MAGRFERGKAVLHGLADPPTLATLVLASFFFVNWYIGAILGESFVYKGATIGPGVLSWISLAIAVGIVISVLVRLLREAGRKSA